MWTMSITEFDNLPKWCGWCVGDLGNLDKKARVTGKVTGMAWIRHSSWGDREGVRPSVTVHADSTPEALDLLSDALRGVLSDWEALLG